MDYKLYFKCCNLALDKPIDVGELVQRIKEDIGDIGYDVSLAVTHVNEFRNEELLNLTDINVKYLFYEETRKLFEKGA